MLEMLADKFCSCIGQVQKKLTDKNEGRAIAICVKSVLKKRGKTLKNFTCRGKKPTLQTQTPKNKTRKARRF